MEPNVSHLPSSAQRLVALIGLPATVLLVERHGGKELKLYARGNSVADLAAIIGRAEADKLFDYFGSDPIGVPRCTAALRELRNSRIHADFDRLTGAQGLSGQRAIHHIVESFGLTERQIWRILKTADVPRLVKKPVDERQLSLI
jgi:hypothetical protein